MRGEKRLRRDRGGWKPEYALRGARGRV